MLQMIFNKLKLFVTRVIICAFAFLLLQKCQPTFNPGTSWTASGKVQSTKGQTKLNWFILISDSSKTPEDIIECHSNHEHIPGQNFHLFYILLKKFKDQLLH